MKKHSTFIKIAHAVASESHCVRMRVGAVLVKDGLIVSTGTNGTPRGYANCNEVVGISIPMEDHHHWSQKFEIHAEMNAMLQSPVDIRGSVMYVTDTPCFNCAKHMIAAGVKEIHYDRMYDRYLKELAGEWDQVLEFCADNNVSINKV